jgi:hypothetical protein
VTKMKAKATPSLAELGESLSRLTHEDIERCLKEGQEAVRLAEEKRRQPPETPTGKCVFCFGEVKGEHLQEFVDPWRGPIIGPGGRDQYAWVFQGYHCVQCGLRYEFLPPADVIVASVLRASGGIVTDHGHRTAKTSRPRRSRKGA